MSITLQVSGHLTAPLFLYQMIGHANSLIVAGLNWAANVAI